MIRPVHFLLTLFFLGLGAASAPAHYNMLLPEAASVKRGEAVHLLYQWGHPFEHQLFNAPAPDSLMVLTPDGKRTDLLGTLEKIVLPVGEQKVDGSRGTFTPQQRGDYVFLLNTPPIWMEEEHEFYQDTVKVVLHVQAQTGWDASGGQGFEILSLTRPYGLQPGTVFQAQVLAEGKPLPGSLVEIEHYNPEPPRELPPDEHITRTVKTDPNGVVTCSLLEPGWWCLTAQRSGGTREHEGKSYPVRQRTTFWVFVDDKNILKPAR